MDDLISRKALIAEYDRVHVGPPGGARKLIEEAPEVKPKVVAEIKIDNDALQRMVSEAVEQIKAEPDIVYCKECRHACWQAPGNGLVYCYCRMHTRGGLKPNDYCSYGEKGESDEAD